MESEEMTEFKRKDTKEIYREIKSYVFRVNIKQNIIAEMAHVSQSNVSKYLRGDDVSGYMRDSIYLWYLTVRKNPQSLREHILQRQSNMTFIVIIGEP